MNHKLTNGMKMWKGNGNRPTATLLSSLKGFEILHQERRGQVNIIVMGAISHRFIIFLFLPTGKRRPRKIWFEDLEEDLGEMFRVWIRKTRGGNEWATVMRQALALHGLW